MSQIFDYDFNNLNADPVDFYDQMLWKIANIENQAGWGFCEETHPERTKQMVKEITNYCNHWYKTQYVKCTSLKNVPDDIIPIIASYAQDSDDVIKKLIYCKEQIIQFRQRKKYE